MSRLLTKPSDREIRRTNIRSHANICYMGLVFTVMNHVKQFSFCGKWIYGTNCFCVRRQTTEKALNGAHINNGWVSILTLFFTTSVFMRWNEKWLGTTPARDNFRVINRRLQKHFGFKYQKLDNWMNCGADLKKTFCFN